MAQKYSDPSRSGGQMTTEDDSYEASQQQNPNYPGRSDRGQTATAGFEPGGSSENAGAYNDRADASSQRAGASNDTTMTQGTGNRPLLRDPESLRQRWESIQVGFVDSPREAVGEAEDLVSSAIGEIANVFRQQRERLEGSWSQGQDPSTDDLRIAFQSYRDFFGRLLQV